MPNLLAEVIGAALAAKAAGAGARPVAVVCGRPLDTVRGWLRRFEARAGLVRAFFLRLLVEVGVDPVPPAQAPSVFADAVAAVAGAAVAAASRWPGTGEVPPWWLACAASPAAGAGLAAEADQHQFPLMPGSAGLGAFAGCACEDSRKGLC